MEQDNSINKRQELIQSIVDNAQYDVKTKISASLRYTGGTNIEKTERTPEAYQMFVDVYRDTIKEQLGDEADEAQVNAIIDEAFEAIISECTSDFFLYRQKVNSLVKFIYLMIFVILVLAFIFHMLDWTVF